ncbi:hypothetical protein HDZ31DRAFT_64829 [Schizophyllum fasciatum]
MAQLSNTSATTNSERTLSTARDFALFTRTGLYVHAPIPKGIPGKLVVTQNGDKFNGGHQTWTIDVCGGEYKYIEPLKRNTRVGTEGDQQRRMEKGIKIRDMAYEPPFNPLPHALARSAGGRILPESAPANTVRRPRACPRPTPALVDLEQMIGELCVRFNGQSMIDVYMHDRQPERRIPVPGVISRRLIRLGWFTEEEVREQGNPIDVQALEEYDALCARRVAISKLYEPGECPFDENGEYPWRVNPAMTAKCKEAMDALAEDRAEGRELAQHFLQTSQSIYEKGKQVCELKDLALHEMEKEERAKAKVEARIRPVREQMERWMAEEGHMRDQDDSQAPTSLEERQKKAAMEEAMAQQADDDACGPITLSGDSVTDISSAASQGKRAIDEVEESGGEGSPSKRAKRIEKRAPSSTGKTPAHARRVSGRLSSNTSLKGKLSAPAPVFPPTQPTFASPKASPASIFPKAAAIPSTPPPPSLSPRRKRRSEDDETAVEDLRSSPKKQRTSSDQHLASSTAPSVPPSKQRGSVERSQPRLSAPQLTAGSTPSRIWKGIRSLLGLRNGGEGAAGGQAAASGGQANSPSTRSPASFPNAKSLASKQPHSAPNQRSQRLFPFKNTAEYRAAVGNGSPAPLDSRGRVLPWDWKYSYDRVFGERNDGRVSRSGRKGRVLGTARLRPPVKQFQPNPTELRPPFSASTQGSSSWSSTSASLRPLLTRAVAHSAATATVTYASTTATPGPATTSSESTFSCTSIPSPPDTSASNAAPSGGFSINSNHRMRGRPLSRNKTERNIG